jgi:hypothetical protein
MFLQQTNLMTDRGGRHVQFVGGERQVQMPRSRLEGPQRVQGRQRSAKGRIHFRAPIIDLLN